MLWRDVVGVDNCRSVGLCFEIFDSGIQVHLCVLMSSSCVLLSFFWSDWISFSFAFKPSFNLLIVCLASFSCCPRSGWSEAWCREFKGILIGLGC